MVKCEHEEPQREKTFREYASRHGALLLRVAETDTSLALEVTKMLHAAIPSEWGIRLNKALCKVDDYNKATELLTSEHEKVDTNRLRDWPCLY